MQNSFPAEFAFAAACCRWPQTADTGVGLDRLAQEALDWPLVLRIAERHRVVGLVRHALHAARVPHPVHVQSLLERRSTAIARQNLASTAETLRLQRRFEEAGIDVVVLKGAALAQQAYGSTAFKQGRDIDLLVPQAHAFAALRLLETDGYSLVDPARTLTDAQRHAYTARGYYQMELAHARRGTRVELNWRLSENPRLLAVIDAFSQRGSRGSVPDRRCSCASAFSGADCRPPCAVNSCEIARCRGW